MRVATKRQKPWPNNSGVRSNRNTIYPRSLVSADLSDSRIRKGLIHSRGSVDPVVHAIPGPTQSPDRFTGPSVACSAIRNITLEDVLLPRRSLTHFLVGSNVPNLPVSVPDSSYLGATPLTLLRTTDAPYVPHCGFLPDRTMVIEKALRGRECLPKLSGT